MIYIPKITGWKKGKDEPKHQVWSSRESRVSGDKSQQPTQVMVRYDPKARNEKWMVRIRRPNKNPRSPGFKTIKRDFSKKSKSEDFAIDWMRNNKY